MRIALASITAVLVGLALFEVTMQPSGSERAELAVIFVLMATLSGVAAAFLPLLARRFQRLIVTLFALALVSLVVASVGLAVAANRMFISDHDLTLVLVVLGFGLIAAVGFAVAAARGLTTDLSRMSSVARDVASGNLAARTSVDRADEIGDLARDLDELARLLQEATIAREQEDTRRRSFFAAVSHDLRTPLASMQAATEALRDGVAADPDRYLASLLTDVRALQTLVDDLFLLARIQAGDMTLDIDATDVTEVADDVVQSMLPVADDKGVALKLDVDERVVVETAPAAVARVIRNLIDNAIRHTPRGSTVTVTVTGGGGATVVVADEGPGFPPEFIDQAFDSFTRSDASRSRRSGGAGLGLAIANGLVTALGGEIWIEATSHGVVGFRVRPYRPTPPRNTPD
ncbi:MAG: HAMP domain-containing sensor histidine kinase [Acidimicrobiia bacterium]